MLPAPRSIESSSPPGVRPSSARLLWDHQNCLPLGKHLSEGDLILLISPVVAPLYHGPSSTSDPFEPFGRALADRHPWVRHVTYTKTAGITGTHVAFIKRARVVIFVISGLPGPREPSQADLAEITRVIGESRPHIVLACCNIQMNESGRVPFPTVVQIRDYSPHELRTAAAMMFGDDDLNKPISLPPIIVRPPAEKWSVEEWVPADMPGTYDLWCRCVPAKFHMSQSLLMSIIHRDGWGRHYVVRDRTDRHIVGFCATYTTYADAGEERLIGSLALILVSDAYRNRGIGLRLHDQALANLKRTRGVSRLQLGSTFPRLFYGPPVEMSSLDWFRRRGWTVDQPIAGKGQLVNDWIVRFEDLPKEGHISVAGLTFRPCDFAEFSTVLSIVERECARKDMLGWYDPYGVIRNTMNVGDVVVGLEGQTVVAAALIYSPKMDVPIGQELPWASVLGKDVGGVSCIFIADDHPDMVNSRDAVMVRLLYSCAKFLSEQGMRRMFVDGVKGGEDGFQALGFKKWATYKDVWRNI
ncbi:hypothetical protein jhhlp_008708 [Lomentospora prolificans]|uniref:N-acetyltransferase domain-containing protein n=1 Tax=Lomentospora prolificans TaxID=41688 RepID=A0A2N3MYS6_9PEZI|nr:hypothetical protein jhhlp_008708 [Lomentospora prolificans]